jgi:hypothetical protein
LKLSILQKFDGSVFDYCLQFGKPHATRGLEGIMTDGALLPRYFKDLATASVYYQLIGREQSQLEPVLEECCFDCDSDGCIHYYKTTSMGTYVRAEYPLGDFLKATLPDGRQIYFHYSQVFSPTAEAQKRMGVLTRILGIAYQNANRQMALMTEFVREAEMINTTIEKFQKVFSDLTAMAVNYDLATQEMVQLFAPGQLKAFDALKITSPISSLRTRCLPQLYVRVTQPDLWWNGYLWEFFFIDVGGDGKLFKNIVHEKRVCYGRFGEPSEPPEYKVENYVDHPRIKEKTDNMDRLNGALLTQKSEAFDTNHHRRWYGGFTPSVYFKCIFTDEGQVAYEHLYGGKNNGESEKVYEIFENGISGSKSDVKPVLCGAERQSLDQIKQEGKDSFITATEVQKILDTLQMTMSCHNNQLQEIIMEVNAIHGEMEQSFGTATAVIEAFGETKRRVTTNLR